PIDAAVPAIDGPFAQAACDYKEPNDTVATAAPVTPRDPGPAALCGAGDRDFYKITVPAMTAQVEIRIAFAQRSNGDLDLRLTDKTGQMMLAQSLGFGEQEAIVCPAASPPCAALAADDYVFEVFPAVAGEANAYTLAVAFTPAAAITAR
ncbi:MAG: hypothetical protein ABIY55_36030, partial [Kofleriaceae bacterium]